MQTPEEEIKMHSRVMETQWKSQNPGALQGPEQGIGAMQEARSQPH